MLPQPALLPGSGPVWGSAGNPVWPGERPFSCLSYRLGVWIRGTQNKERADNFSQVGQTLTKPKQLMTQPFFSQVIYTREVKPHSSWEGSGNFTCNGPGLERC